MKWPEREGIVVTGVLSVLLLAWLGFFLHRSPRFPGSGLGAVFGIAGAVLMLVPLAYPMAKRISWLNARITPRVSMKTLLTLHVYAGLLGPLLAIIHTGHKFDSWLGTTLTATMLLVVLSGFAVRYLLTFVAHEMKDKLALLQTARGDLDNAWWKLENSPAEMRVLPRAPVLTAAMASLGLDVRPAGPAGEVTRIAESVADLEYSVRMHEFFKRWFGRSLKLHIVLSVILYVLLALHIGAGVQYGLRWFS
ncbi:MULTISPECIES: hypothetical protein [unclassified Variovorax]|uniref:hypothetical protein n=1 Tax=unclassified Variovorax TaxID=663243 RepID=UPI00076C6EB5|nr:MULTISPECIES: hypothetical protein [unclassified Variovorax]KWT91625.1 putative membrane protein of unknown function [Variovorax sp. WDL1]PNG49005.1 hypothetical protein CHC07_06647 [Variovorax sp. B4]PNG49717.1 hypothetical protein CHC06_05298 [Variovorax sp. B2]VTV18580.1 hypothetical protein WDL1P2_00268 [Variovorax sp. WDL1]